MITWNYYLSNRSHDQFTKENTISDGENGANPLNFYYLEYRLKQPFNYDCFFLNRSTQVTKSGNYLLKGLIKLFLASHRCTIREKKKRRIANASFSGTKCTKDINIIAQKATCTSNKKSTICQFYVVLSTVQLELFIWKIVPSAIFLLFTVKLELFMELFQIMFTVQSSCPLLSCNFYIKKPQPCSLLSWNLTLVVKFQLYTGYANLTLDKNWKNLEKVPT